MRWAHLFQIPITPPKTSTFPFATHHLQRALAALESTSPDSLPTALDPLYASLWAHGSGPAINDPSTFGPILEEALGKELATKAVELGREQEAKELVQRNTERAFERGAFGMPWFECVNGEGEREGFWGFDHLAVVVRFLGLDQQDGGVEMGGTGLVEGMKSML